MDQESVTLEVDPRSVLAAIKQANQAIDGWEKGTVKAGDSMQKSLERMADMLLKVNDKSRTSMERLTQSIEKQAAAYGKTGIDRMIAERDRIIKKLGDEWGMIDRVTASYEKMIKAARESDNAPVGGEGGGGGKFSFRYAFFGAKDLMEGRYKFALAEAANEAVRLGGTALLIGGVAAGVGAIGYAAYESKEKLKELREQPEKIADAFHELGAAVQSNIDQLRSENDHLGNTIAKLENKPQNLLAEALDDARISADKLSESLGKDLEGVAKLMKANSVGIFGRMLGYAGTGDVEQWFGQYQKQVQAINFAGSENVHRATTAAGSDQAQAEWNRALDASRRSAQGKLAGWIAEAQKPHIEGKGSLFEQSDEPEKRASRLRMLQGLATSLNMEGDVAALMRQIIVHRQDIL